MNQVSMTLLGILADLSYLDRLGSYSDFQVRKSPYQAFGDSSENTSYNCYPCYFYVPHFFALWQGLSSYLYFCFLWFQLVVHRNFEAQCSVCFFIIFLLWDFFPPALADGFSLESVGQYVSSSVKDSSQYFGWSQKHYTFDCLHSFSKSFSLGTKTLMTVPSAPITIGITNTFMFHTFLVL